MARSAPLNCSAHLTPVAAGAIEWGFRPFNEAEHLCVDLPDHPVTITTRDSEGRTTTIHFGNYAKPDEKAAPTFIDIQHIGTRRQDGTGSMYPDGEGPAFEVIGFAPRAAGGDPFDTRDMIGAPSLICIPCDGTEAARKSVAKRTRLYLDDDDLAALYEAARASEGASQALCDRLLAARTRLTGRKEVTG